MPPMQPMQVLLGIDLAPIVAPGVLMFDDVRVVERDEAMDPAIAETEARVRAAGDLNADIGQVRTMYKRLGIDPTKVRPSSEALLRRIRKGDSLPRINSIVDVCNWCSLETQLPFGLYDLDHIEGTEVALRVGAAGEGYEGIRKDRVNVDGRITLADARGAFGNPTSDSARTMVTLDTTRVMFVIYCPREHASQALDRALTLTASRMEQFTAARETLRLAL
jgi:DNA/RNA-binding domain of Phe-tRNA-synthetase-like protein